MPLCSASLSLATLRAHFPSPQRARPRYQLKDGHGYCVGGAHCLALHPAAEAFPTLAALSATLRVATPCLSEPQATEYAAGIVLRHDDGDFTAAWALLGAALERSLL